MILLNIVLLLGGHIFNELREGKISEIKEIADLLRRLLREGNRIVVVAGGGLLAREYISISEKLGATKAVQDIIGIEATRLNAMVLISALFDISYPYVPSSYEEAVKGLDSKGLVIMGGIAPAQSTDAVAAIMAELIRADILVKASEKGGVYERDPKEDPNARKYDRMTYDELERIILEKKFLPGKYDLLDHLALLVLKRSNIPLAIVPPDAESIERALKGEVIGTLVRF
ncbi:MAG: UMP kinase [Thermoproteota archaeon]|uniref:Uridylate kinase n=1 Tax=Candidatus Methanodesulfokora washburnensis TaxID=2478471 RepID=A0A3R9PG75_9CREN|nr:UMP kinase [Candidatus Methanodesulfokores washburnensis]RZN62369.1 MAG: UMP kinase [Candidatus Methanodesulfokores washburnensis]TDA40415.1 MAG: UMP kinase [Candidatus Korarchaeota archaeon]